MISGYDCDGRSMMMVIMMMVTMVLIRIVVI